MKYFTPELFVRFQQTDSERAILEAHAAWERALGEYRQHLTDVSHLLCHGAETLVSMGSLHDAAVLGMWHAHPKLTIALQRENDAGRLHLLTYALVGAPAINDRALPADECTPQADWLYDEVGVDHAAGVFTHAILLSNGWELGLRFDRLEVATPAALLPRAAGQAAGLLQRSA